MPEKSSRFDRRTVLKLSGAGLASVVGTTPTAADPNKSGNPPHGKAKGRPKSGNSDEINIDFNPKNKHEVRKFLLDFQDFESDDEKDRVWEELTQEQQKVVAEGLQPVEFESELRKVSEKEVETAVSTSSYGPKKQETYANYVAGNAVGNEPAFILKHQISWLYDGAFVYDWDHYSELTHLAWGWTDEGETSSNIYANYENVDYLDDSGYRDFTAKVERRVDWAYGGFGITDYYPVSKAKGLYTGVGQEVYDYDPV
jgi:hypothetical protein